MKLKDLYTKSVKVEPQRLEQRDIQNQLQMVYVDKSHDYCEKNNREGSAGTQKNPHRIQKQLLIKYKLCSGGLCGKF